jgi:cytidine deaminase
MDLSKIDLELIEFAKKHIKSHYLEGRHSIAGIVRCQSGKIYTGLNFKYKTRGISMCAERIAIFKAIEEGEILDTILGIKYSPETDTYEVMNSCGECRQVELYHAPLKVIVNEKGILKKVSIEELLPYAYI